MVPVDSLDLMLKFIGRSSLGSTPRIELVKMLELIRNNPETVQGFLSSFSISRFFMRPRIDLESLEFIINKELRERQETTESAVAGEDEIFPSVTLAEIEDGILCPDCDELVSPITSIFELEDIVDNGGVTAVEPVDSLDDIEIQIGEDFFQNNN